MDTPRNEFMSAPLSTRFRRRPTISPSGAPAPPGPTGWVVCWSASLILAPVACRLEGPLSRAVIQLAAVRPVEQRVQPEMLDVEVQPEAHVEVGVGVSGPR